MNFIFTADLHIRDDQPECRIDDFEKTMWSKFRFLKQLSKEWWDAPIIVAGDIFHKWKASPWLLNKCLTRLPSNMLVIAGNHDLPHHNIKEIKRSGLETLIRAKKVQWLSKQNEYVGEQGQIVKFYPFHYGMVPKNVEREEGVFKIAVIHRLVTKRKDQLWRHTSSNDAPSLIRHLKGYDIILTGDNHQTFTCRYKKTTLINPGSFTRQTAAQLEHQPCVYLYNTNKHFTKQIYLPHPDNVVSTKHLEKKKQKNERMVSFVSKLNSTYEIGLSFEKNLEAYFESNNEEETVHDMVWRSVESKV